jgi:hypothetical protein
MEDPEQIENPTSPETLERGLTTDLLTKAVEGAAFTAGGVAVKAAAEQVIDAITNRPEPEPSRIVLPPGVEVDDK